MNVFEDKKVAEFFEGKSEHTIELFRHLVTAFEKAGAVTLHPAKTMIGIDNGVKSVAWVTQFGRNFIHVVFPFKETFHENNCFQKIAQVPGTNQYNHHFRMLYKEDINREVQGFIDKAVKG
jgi:hypothetical protein